MDRKICSECLCSASQSLPSDAEHTLIPRNRFFIRTETAMIDSSYLFYQTSIYFRFSVSYLQICMFRLYFDVKMKLRLLCHWCLAAFTHNWAASSKFGTYRLCEQRRFRRACASTQSHQNLRCLLIQAVSQEEPPDRKPDPWPLWMAGHAQLKFVMTECSKTQIRLTRPNWRNAIWRQNNADNLLIPISPMQYQVPAFI